MRSSISFHGCSAAILALALLLAPIPSYTQETTETEQAALATDDSGEVAPSDDAAADEPPLLTDEEIDALVAPVALYPDALLAQVLVASTYPLEIVKAERWVRENEEMAEEERSDAALLENWDESISVLAAGFPGVITQMGENLDQTEELGEAMLAQSDDVLASVQRLRAQADAVGNLETNNAQTVSIEGDTISIAPTNPEVVYVPTYDSQAIYTTAPAAQPVIVESTTEGFSTGALVTTGLLSFGAGMLVNEIFDDDDDWHGYWGPPRGGYGRRPPIGWGGGYVRPRPIRGGIGNDINVNVERNRVNNVRGGDRRYTNVDRDGRWKPDDRRKNEARNNLRQRKGGAKSANRPVQRDRQRDQLKRKLDTKGGGGAKLQANRSGANAKKLDGAKNRKAGGGAKVAKRKNTGKASAISRKGNLSSAKKATNRGKVSRQKAGGKKAGGKIKRSPKKASRPKAQRKAKSGNKALSRKKGGGKRAGKAKNRGAKSRGGRKGRR